MLGALRYVAATNVPQHKREIDFNVQLLTDYSDGVRTVLVVWNDIRSDSPTFSTLRRDSNRILCNNEPSHAGYFQ